MNWTNSYEKGTGNAMTFEEAAQALATYDRPFVLTPPSEQGSRYWHRARLLSLRNRETAVIKPDGHKKNEETPIAGLKLKKSGNEALRKRPNGMTAGQELRHRLADRAATKVWDGTGGGDVFDVDKYEARHLVQAEYDQMVRTEGESLHPDHWLVVDVKNRNALLDNLHFMPLFDVLARIEAGTSHAYAKRDDAERALTRVIRQDNHWEFDGNALVVMDLEAAMETATMPEPVLAVTDDDRRFEPAPDSGIAEQPNAGDLQSPPVVRVPPENIPVLEALASARETLASVDTPDGGKLELVKHASGDVTSAAPPTASEPPPKKRRSDFGKPRKQRDADQIVADELADELAGGITGAAQRLARAKVGHELAVSKLKEAEVELEAAKRFMQQALKEAGL